MRTPQTVATQNEWTRNAVAIWEKYDDRMHSNNCVDFDDLLLYAVKLLETNEQARTHYSTRFRYVMVDEVQDINRPQYEMMRLISQTHQNLFCVGDTDQGIYGWRGADISCVDKFVEQFNPEITNLNHNYRSTPQIIKVVNAAINQVPSKYRVDITTTNTAGTKPVIKTFRTDNQQTRWIVSEIATLISEGANPNEIAVLYRTNAQSRSYEAETASQQIPVKVVGAVPFYQRAEIKDTLAWLQLAHNPDNEAAYARACKAPRCGIGDKTLATVISQAKTAGQTLIETSLGTKNKKVQTFAQKVLQLQQKLGHNLHEAVDWLYNQDDYITQITKTTTGDPEDKKENLYELAAICQRIDHQNPDPEHAVMKLLEDSSLASSADTGSEIETAAVTLSTMHAAKGKEYEHVYLVDCVEGLMPHTLAEETESGYTEELKLFYVALSRAKTNLTITLPANRYTFKGATDSKPSPFLEPILAHVDLDDRLKEWRQARKIRYRNADLWEPNQKVWHPKFGSGIITQLDGDTAKIDFRKHGTKTMSLTVAPLEML